MKKRVLIACEESGVVRRAFAARGFEAWSNDLKPARDDSQKHLREDCMQAIQRVPWDLIIMHPPCTHICVSGNRYYGRGTDGYHLRVQALNWTTHLWRMATGHCQHVAMENPVGMLKLEVKPHYVQPWQFGHPETKKTGFWLKNLPPLEPTNIAPPPYDQRISNMSKRDRAERRSVTYQGMAEAMAEQWGQVI